MPNARSEGLREVPPKTALAPPLVSESRLARFCRMAAEAILLAMVCLAPWAFGAVEAWAENLLGLGVAAVTILVTIADLGTDRTRRFACLPGLTILGLALLAWIQTASLPPALRRPIDRTAAALHSELVAERGVRVAGDSGPPVGPPRATISRDPEATSNEAWRLLAGWLTFQGVLGLGRGSAAYRRFSVALVLNATLLAFFALIQWLSGSGKIYGIVPTMSANGGPFVDHNHLAAYLNIGLGFALAGLLAPRRSGFPSWFAYAASMIVAGILVSQSRSGFVATLAATTVLVLVLRPSVARLGVGLAVLSALVFAFLATLATTAPIQRLATLLGNEPFAERKAIWGQVSRAWPSGPVFGLGLGSFSAATAPYLSIDRGEFFAHAEDDYLEYLVEGGVIGLILVLSGLGATLQLTRRALRAEGSECASTLIPGGLFAVAALGVQCLGDFPMHIPAIALTAVVLVGHIARLGLEIPDPSVSIGAEPEGARKRRLMVSALAAPALLLASLGVAAQGMRLARASAALMSAGVAPPGAEKPTAALLGDDRPDLERMQAGLERALHFRPDWAEGHLRLGLVHLGLYDRMAAEWIAREGRPPADVDRMSNPLWLFGLMHDRAEKDLSPVASLLAHEPIRLHLVPAARSFLEARRCCPTTAVAHAELAGLDYLLEGGPPSSIHGERGLRWAGADSPTLVQLAWTAARSGDFDLTARCLRKHLIVRDKGWHTTFNLAESLLPPDRILRDVLPNGRLTLLFAEHLDATPDRARDRERFLRVAVERLPHDSDLAPAERDYLEARALSLLGDQERASTRFEAALRAEPKRAEWRAEFVGRLIRWGRLEKAHDLAVLGLHFAPGHPDTTRALNESAEALARRPSREGNGSP